MPIRILDQATVGRIAAGEVVERPASVVKELVENSLDAGATSITVEMKQGGIELLRVTDNGCGIEPGQVRLAFENHATSKLQSPEQLDDIRTLGFRGEALPSIASVAHVEMTTRARGQESGVRLSVDGGRDMRVVEAGCPEGTTVVMRDLFYNIPVRREFLKKPQYEGSLVHDVVARLMIGNPQVSFRLINNGRTVFHSFGDGQLRHAVFAAHGRETAEKMVPVDAAQGGTRIHGLLGVNDLAKPTRAHEMFFINGRSVRCALLSKALEEVARTRVTIGLYPMCALELTLLPNAVDVNVHPNKLEVRFRDEDATYAAVLELLGTAFRGEKVLDFGRDAVPVKPVERAVHIVERPPMPAPQTPAPPQDERPLRDAVQPRTEAPTRTAIPPQAAEPPRMPPLPTQAQPPRAMEMPSPLTRLREQADPALSDRQIELIDVSSEEKPEQKGGAEFRVIGVAFKTYIILEVGEALLLIDQHAAHERLRYEAYCRDLEEGTASQQLLTPLVLRVSAREMALIQDNLGLLNESGYAVEPFGAQDIRVTAVPHVLGKAELKPIFLDMLDSLGRLRSATLDVRRAEIMQMSCKGAVKGGDRLTDSEIRSLVEQMLGTGAPPTCPHGRPVVRAVQQRELEKWFKRIQ